MSGICAFFLLLNVLRQLSEKCSFAQCSFWGVHLACFSFLLLPSHENSRHDREGTHELLKHLAVPVSPRQWQSSKHVEKLFRCMMVSSKVHVHSETENVSKVTNKSLAYNEQQPCPESLGIYEPYPPCYCEPSMHCLTSCQLHI